MKYIYPIVITKTEQEFSPAFVVCLPDFDAMTQGETLADAIEMGEDLLSILAVQYEDQERSLPESDSVAELMKRNPDSIVTLVVADTDKYRKQYDSRPTKKTLSIPAWLNTKAEEEGINFSQTLQEALKEKLAI